MKNLLLAFLVPSFGLAQTPPPDSFVPLQSPGPGTAAVSNLIDFEPYPTGTVITNQYQAEGVLFSGFAGSGDPDIYDYGPTLYTRVLKSDTWYNPIKIQFVDPLNPGTYAPVGVIEFDNPEDVSGDYIIIDVYDSSGTNVYHGVSLSTVAHHVTINLGADIGAYMILDDSLNTAYIIDNLQTGFVTGLAAGPTALSASSIYPNPFSTTANVIFRRPLPANGALLILTDLSGTTVRQERLTQREMSLAREDLAAGMYLYRLMADGVLVAAGKLLVE